MAGGSDSHPGEGAGAQRGMPGVEASAHPQGAGGLIDPVVDKVELALVGEVVLAGQLQFYRPALIGGDLGKVAVPAALVDIEVGVDLVGADDGGQHALAGADHVAHRQVGAGDATADRCADLGVGQIETSTVELCLQRGDLGILGLGTGAPGLGFLAGHQVAPDQLIGTVGLTVGAGQLGPAPGKPRLQLTHPRLEGRQVQANQRLALFDQGAFLEQDLGDLTGDPGTQGDTLGSLEAGGVAIPVRDRLTHRLDHLDPRRGRRARAIGSVTLSSLTFAGLAGCQQQRQGGEPQATGQATYCTRCLTRCCTTCRATRLAMSSAASAIGTPSSRQVVRLRGRYGKRRGGGRRHHLGVARGALVGHLATPEQKVRQCNPRSRLVLDRLVAHY